ncbi:hypothetical protein [Phenylobacterium sp. SCN 70-31]|uniref:hypothetical protein n=1 Tax=Phenylobacterium sp. SCN 70-31 TaxID=1660129 RepID=UPI0025F9CAC2|nr:hypothetical protein [Phenylobacterium sp. SCN 70-31]
MLKFNIYMDGDFRFERAKSVYDGGDVPLREVLIFCDAQYVDDTSMKKDAITKPIKKGDSILIGTKTFAKESDMLIYKMKHAGVVTMERVEP